MPQRDNGPHLYRSQRQVVAFCFMFVLYLFITASSVVFAPEAGSKVTWGIFGIAICSIVLRGASTRVVGAEQEVRVRNLFGSFSLPWQAVERFEIGRSGLLRAVCLIHTRDGRTLHAFAIQENNLGESWSKLPARLLVQELNDELQARRAPVADGRHMSPK